ncbi:hypothetical protein OsI_23428 [Oryza sativa Indica Group]|uniref:Uncharacterized protein n=1 Tax=Oryza sativa subsp. indica TaxID=39946 RepID=A2YE85_ORYSI|nr:hypothetical protein OsI_23428 [Oryza sativa Indica Group]
MEAFVPGGAGAAVAAVGGFVAAAALAERAGVIAPRKRSNAPPDLRANQVCIRHNFRTVLRHCLFSLSVS